MTTDSDNDSKKFNHHWKMPASQIKKIRKEYASSQERIAQMTPDKFKDFREISEEVFNYFEEISGKRTNRDIMVANTSYYFDEGFEVPEMKLFICDQMGREFFRDNPEKFTIMNLLPIKDQDRITLAWDGLAYFKSILKKQQEMKEGIGEGKRVRMVCGHPSTEGEQKKHPGACRVCILEGDLVAIMRDPYLAIEILPEDEEDQRNIARWFQRLPDVDKKIEDYVSRTLEIRTEIIKKSKEDRLAKQA